MAGFLPRNIGIDRTKYRVIHAQTIDLNSLGEASVNSMDGIPSQRMWRFADVQWTSRTSAGCWTASRHFRDRLSIMDLGEEVKLNIQGLAIGVDVGDEEHADEIVKECRRGGLLVATEGSVVTTLPALTIDRPAARAGLDIFESSI